MRTTPVVMILGASTCGAFLGTPRHYNRVNRPVVTFKMNEGLTTSDEVGMLPDDYEPPVLQFDDDDDDDETEVVDTMGDLTRSAQALFGGFGSGMFQKPPPLGNVQEKPVAKVPSARAQACSAR